MERCCRRKDCCRRSVLSIYLSQIKTWNQAGITYAKHFHNQESVVAVLSVLGFAGQKQCDVWLVKEL